MVLPWCMSKKTIYIYLFHLRFNKIRKNFVDEIMDFFQFYHEKQAHLIAQFWYYKIKLF